MADLSTMSMTIRELDNKYGQQVPEQLRHNVRDAVDADIKIGLKTAFGDVASDIISKLRVIEDTQAKLSDGKMQFTVRTRAVHKGGDISAIKLQNFDAVYEHQVMVPSTLVKAVTTGGLSPREMGYKAMMDKPINEVTSKAMLSIVDQCQTSTGNQMFDFDTYFMNIVVRRASEPTEMTECFVKLWLTYYQSLALKATDIKAHSGFDVLCADYDVDTGYPDDYDTWRDVYSNYDLIFDGETLGEDLGKLAVLCIVPYPYFKVQADVGGVPHHSVACAMQVRGIPGFMIERQGINVGVEVINDPDRLKLNIIRLAKWHKQTAQCADALQMVTALCSSSMLLPLRAPMSCPTQRANVVAPALGQRNWKGTDVEGHIIPIETDRVKWLFGLAVMSARMLGAYEDFTSLGCWRTNALISANRDRLSESINIFGLMEEGGTAHWAKDYTSAEGISGAWPIVRHLFRTCAALMVNSGVNSLGAYRVAPFCMKAPLQYEYAWSSQYEKEITVTEEMLHANVGHLDSLPPREREERRAGLIVPRNILNSWLGSTTTAGIPEMAQGDGILAIKCSKYGQTVEKNANGQSELYDRMVLQMGRLEMMVGGVYEGLLDCVVLKTAERKSENGVVYPPGDTEKQVSHLFAQKVMKSDVSGESKVDGLVMNILEPMLGQRILSRREEVSSAVLHRTDPKKVKKPDARKAAAEAVTSGAVEQPIGYGVVSAATACGKKVAGALNALDVGLARRLRAKARATNTARAFIAAKRAVDARAPAGAEGAAGRNHVYHEDDIGKVATASAYTPAYTTPRERVSASRARRSGMVLTCCGWTPGSSLCHL